MLTQLLTMTTTHKFPPLVSCGLQQLDKSLIPVYACAYSDIFIILPLHARA